MCALLRILSTVMGMEREFIRVMSMWELAALMEREGGENVRMALNNDITLRASRLLVTHTLVKYKVSLLMRVDSEMASCFDKKKYFLFYELLD